MTTRLTAADRKVLRRAIAEIRDRWHQAERNLGVKARAAPGAWDMPPETAKRKQRAIANRIDALETAAGKLNLD